MSMTKLETGVNSLAKPSRKCFVTCPGKPRNAISSDRYWATLYKDKF